MILNSSEAYGKIEPFILEKSAIKSMKKFKIDSRILLTANRFDLAFKLSYLGELAP